MKDLLLIGGLAFLVYQMAKKGGGAGGEDNPQSQIPNPRSPQAALADETAYGGGYAAGGVDDPTAIVRDLPREYAPWYGSGWAFDQPGGGGPTYRDQYPVRPGVIDAGGGLDIGDMDESGWAN